MATVQQAETEPRIGQVRFDGFISYSHTADELLAPRLQAALQTFAKPWWKRRALRVFRDQSSLSANPHLWSSITAALDASDWFILLTSPEAAGSLWVDREVSYWREQKDPERIIPVLTDGTLAWDEASGRLDPHSSVPPSLLDAFTGEPRWVDLRWAEEETQLDLRNGRFREVVADIASSLRGVPKDDLESEEVRQHRRTRRTAWGAGIALAVLAVAAITGTVIAIDQREQAQAQRVLAEAETVRAESAESLARSRELAASAINVLDDNPELSVLLGLEAIESAPPGAEQPVEAINALREAIHASRLRTRADVSLSGGFVALDLSPDGTRLATVSQVDARVVVTDVATGRQVSSFTDPTTVDNLSSVSFSADGSVLAVGVSDSAWQGFQPGMPPRPGSEIPDDLPPRVILLRVESGEVLRTIDYPSCVEAAPLPRFSPDGAWLAVAGLSGPDCRADQWAVELLDVVTFESVHRWETTAETALTWTADGSRFSVASDTSPISGTTVIEVATREIVLQYPAGRGILSPDGQRLVVEGGFGLGGLDVIEVATGTRTDILTGFDLLVGSKAFTADSSRLIVGTGGQDVLVFDLESGKLVHRLSPTGVALSFDCLAQCETLLQSNAQGEVLTWDLSTTAGGEFNSVDTGYFVNADSLVAAGDTGVFLGFSSLRIHPDVVPFDRAIGSISSARRFTETNSPIPLPDGRVLLLEVSDTAPEWGPVVAWDPVTDSVDEVAGCWTTAEEFDKSGIQGTSAIPCADREGDYFFLDKAFLSPDESSLLITDAGGEVRIFDAHTLMEQSVPPMPAGHRTVLTYGSTWLISSNGQVAKVVDLSDGRVVATLSAGSSDSWSFVTAGGDLAVIYEWSKELTVYDTASWEAVTSFVPGMSRGVASSPDGSKLLTAQIDGYVRIWDSRAGTELFRIPLPGASDGYWLDETHIVIGAATGLWTTITLDPEELKDLAVSRLTRGFTAEECETYRIEPCPSLETIKSR